MSIGQRIKAAREQAGITQVELGEKIGVSGVAIMRYEKGTREPRLEQFQRIASALDVDVNWLMSGYAVDGSIRVTPSPEQQEFGELMKKYADGVITDDELQRLGELQARTPPTKEKFEKLTDTLEQMKQCLLPLNDEGQQKVVKHAADYARDLAEIPRYRNQIAHTAPPAPAGDTDTPAAQDAPEGPQKPKEGE